MVQGSALWCTREGSSGKVQGRQETVVQGSTLWCARQRWTPAAGARAKQGSTAGEGGGGGGGGGSGSGGWEWEMRSSGLAQGRL